MIYVFSFVVNGDIHFYIYIFIFIYNNNKNVQKKENCPIYRNYW